jgi:uncharacterized Zn finger protein
MPRFSNTLGITDRQLLKLAGERSFERGDQYFRSGMVLSIAVTDSRIVGRVQGQEAYRAVLSLRERKLDWACTCPMGDERKFCKHCVALGLAYIAACEGDDCDNDEDDFDRPRLIPMDQVKQYLLQQPHAELVDWVLYFVEQNAPGVSDLLEAAGIETTLGDDDA